MHEYESSTHFTKSDRFITYGIFLVLVALTITLYYLDVDGFNRLSLYCTIPAFMAASWAWLSGHYDKKYRRLAAVHAKCVPAPRLYAVADLPEPTYVHKGEAVPLGEALGVSI